MNHRQGRHLLPNGQGYPATADTSQLAAQRGSLGRGFCCSPGPPCMHCDAASALPTEWRVCFDGSDLPTHPPALRARLQPNMRFVKGEIERLAEAGLQDGSVDLIISNCVVSWR